VVSLAEIDPRKVAEVVRGSSDKNASVTHFSALSPKPKVRFRWKRARLSLSGLNPHLPSFIQIHLKLPRFISENDLPDRYNIR